MTWERYDRRSTGRWGDVFGAVSMGVTSKGKEGFHLRILMSEKVLQKITAAPKPRLALEFGDKDHAGMVRIFEDEKYGFRAFKTGAVSGRWLLRVPLPPQFATKRVTMQHVANVEFPSDKVMQGVVPPVLLMSPPKVAAKPVNGLMADASAPPRENGKGEWRSAIQGPKG